MQIFAILAMLSTTGIALCFPTTITVTCAVVAIIVGVAIQIHAIATGED